MTSYAARKKSYQVAVARGAQWLLSQQQDDGGFGSRVPHMSPMMVVPVTLLSAGHPEQAYRLVGYIKEHFLCADGAFDLPEFKAGLPVPTLEHCYPYSWVAYAAHLNLAFEVSIPAMSYILKFQDPGGGGMFGPYEDGLRGKGVIDATVTGIAGQAAIITGRIAEAMRMGEHLVDNVIASNPDMSDRFYPAWDTESGLIMDTNRPQFPNMPWVVRRQATGQKHAVTAVMIALLTDLYRAGGQRRFLEAAELMYEFVAGGPGGLYTHTLSHKLLWAFAWLYRATGDPKHIEAACKLGDYLVSIQEPDGSFVHWGIIKSRDEWPYPQRVNITAQFVLWIARAAQLL